MTCAEKFSRNDLVEHKIIIARGMLCFLQFGTIIEIRK